MKLLTILLLGLGALSIWPVADNATQDGYLRVSTQDYLLRSWTTEQGLPVNAVNDLTDSDEGYLWLTTHNGLVRFDGVNFRVFNTRNTEELPSNRFVYAMKGLGGELWFAPEYGGLVRYKDNEFTYFSRENGFTDAELSARPLRRGSEIFFPTQDGIFSYKDGELRQIGSSQGAGSWINNLHTSGDMVMAATNDGIKIISGDNSYTMYRRNGFSSTPVHEVFLLDNRVYAAGSDRVYRAENDGSLQPVRTISPLNGRKILRTYQDRQMLVLVTDEGVIFARTWDDYRYLEYRNNAFDEIEEIHRDRRGRLWLRDSKGHLYQYRNREVMRFNPAGKMSDVMAGMIFEDQFDNVWIRTQNAGLLKVTDPSIRSIGRNEGLAGNNVLGIFEDSNRNLWVGSGMAGITKITNSGRVIRFESAPGGQRLNFPHAFEELPDGRIVAGIDGVGLVYFDGNRITEVRSLGDHPRDNDIRAIELGYDNRTLWVGTGNGLKRVTLDGNVMRNFTKDHGLGSNRVFTLKQTPEGHLWIATGGGISYFDGHRFMRYSTDQGLPMNVIRALHIDQDNPNILWFGTEGRGIGKLSNGRIKTLGSDGGLFDDMILNITEDENGRLWMSTNRGIFYIRKDEALSYFEGQLPNVSSIVYTRNEGLRNEEANGGFRNSSVLTGEGKLLFSTQGGVAIFDTRRPNTQIMLPIPRIEAVLAGDKRFHPNSSIELEPGMNDFTIEFTGFEFSAPDQINFKYKLEGYDQDWNIVGNQRSATYTNLPPREYRFLVTASNHLNIWNNDIATASISIRPHFWQQIWFYFLVGFLLISVPFTLYFYRVRSLRKNEERLHTEVLSRTSELEKEKEAALEQQKLIQQQAEDLSKSNQVKDRFFSIIAHDLRSPFGGILGLSKMMDEDYKDLTEDEIREYIRLIHESSEHVFKLMENLLSWARLQSGHVKPKKEPVDLEKVVYEALNIYKPLAEEKGIKVSVVCEPNLVVKADANMFDTIVRNLISNAIKFTHPGGRFSIKTWQADEEGVLQVKDTGVGIKPEDMENLFSIDRNKSRNGTSSETGTGLGMPLAREMAEAQGGTIEVKSEVDEGTTFTVRLERHNPGYQTKQFRVSLQDNPKTNN